MENQSVGIVLEGGAMRGIFTAGVMDVLMERGVTFPACVGVSAGAAFGCNLKSNQPGRVLRYNLNYCRDRRYCSVRSLIKTGDMFGAQFCYKTLPDELDIFDRDVFKSNPMQFWVVCTDVLSGKPHYQRLDEVNDDCYTWIRASASMPLVSRVVHINGGSYLDGGISDSIPIRFMERQFEKNIVVLTQPRDYIKQPASPMWLFRRALRRYPNMVTAIANRHQNYNETRDYVFSREQSGSALIICPNEPLPIGRVEHHPEVIQKTYDLGRKAAEDKLTEIFSFLQD